MILRFQFLFIALLCFSNLRAQDEEELSVINKWKLKTAIDSKVKRKLTIDGNISLAEFWKGHKTQILVKTRDKEGVLFQVSKSVNLKEGGGDFHLEIPYFETYHDLLLVVKSDVELEFFLQTYKKKQKKPESIMLGLKADDVLVQFPSQPKDKWNHKKKTCRINGFVENKGMISAKDIKIKVVFSSQFNGKVKELEIVLKDKEGANILVEAGDRVRFEHKLKGLKSYDSVKYSLSYDFDQKETGQQEIASIGTNKEMNFDFTGEETDAYIKKVSFTFNDKKELVINVTIYNGLDKDIKDPTINLKLTDDEGQELQPIELELEGVVLSKQSFSFDYPQAKYPDFSGVVTGLKYKL